MLSCPSSSTSRFGVRRGLLSHRWCLVELEDMVVRVCDARTQEAEAGETVGKKWCLFIILSLRKDKQAPSGLLYKAMNDICEVLSSSSRNSPNVPPSNIITLRVRISIYEFWGDKIIQIIPKIILVLISMVIFGKKSHIHMVTFVLLFQMDGMPPAFHDNCICLQVLLNNSIVCYYMTVCALFPFPSLPPSFPSSFLPPAILLP